MISGRGIVTDTPRIGKARTRTALLVCAFLIAGSTPGTASILRTLEERRSCIARIDATAGAVYASDRRLRLAARRSSGAAVILSAEGVLVTNAHIVGSHDKVRVRFHDGSELEGTVRRAPEGTDIAFITVRPKTPLSPVPLSPAGTAKLGDTVYTVGSSGSNDGTISQGRITGLGHPRGSGATELLQVSLNIYEGDSGSPLFDAQGRLLGLLNAARVRTDRAAYAIPSSKIIDSFRAITTGGD